MRQVKKMVFMGSSNTPDEVTKIKKILENAFSILSGLQQPPQPRSNEEYNTWKVEALKARADLYDATRDIVTALTGQEVIFEDLPRGVSQQTW